MSATAATIHVHETTKSLAYDVGARRLRERLGCSRWTLRNYQHEGLIPWGKKKKGVRGIFFTRAQANKLMDSLDSSAERFPEF